MSSPSSLITLGLIASLLSCKGINTSYCAEHPEDADCASVDAAIDSGAAPGGCTRDEHCMAPSAVCDVARATCVECTAEEPAACDGATPVCGDGACRACALDAECASLTCLPDGSCVAVERVLYAAPDGGRAAMCTADARCTLGRAVERINDLRTTIRLDAGYYAVTEPLVLAAGVRLIGREAVLDRDGSGSGAVLAIAADTRVELDYLTVRGGDGDDTGVGISCTAAALTGRGLHVLESAAAGIQSLGCVLDIADTEIAENRGAGINASGGSVTLVRSVVRANQRGGLVLAGAKFDVRNNAIVKNGSATSAFGGVLISQITERANHVFDFNTVAHNQASTGGMPGVICSVVNAQLTFTSNIVYGNAEAAQVEGASCVWRYSDIGPLPVVGTGNLAREPMFVAPARDNFHLQALSPLRDVADPDAELADDIDGEPRPQGGRRDMGADEIK